jgi:UDP-N-acetylglucosamine:LPS N-acetylglucosamine transferase
VPRRLSLESVKALFGIFRGMLRAFAIVRRLRPRIVIAVGGHAAFPCAFAAGVLRVPLVLLEQNKRAGAVNRAVRWFATASAVSFEGTDLPRAVVTGNPLRPELRDAARAGQRTAARRAMGVGDERVLIAAFSGSLGSRRINTAVRGLVERWADRSDLAVHHVIGRRDWEADQAVLPTPPAGGLDYRAVEYEDHVETMLAAADLAVTRAGGTVFELAAFGVPSILVPLPIAPRDHQTANAQAMVETGGVVWVPDDELDTDRLVAELGPLVADPVRRHTMSEAIRSAARLDAAGAVADLVEAHARSAA